MIRQIDRAGILRKTEYHEHVQIVDVGGLDSYENFHLPRAIHLPLEELKSRARMTLGKEGPEIIIHDDGEGDRAHAAADVLLSLGYHGIFVYAGGKQDWVRAGLMTEVNAAPSPAQYNATFPSEMVQPEQILNPPPLAG